MDADGGGEGVSGGVDDGDRAGLGVDRVDLVALRVDRDSRGIVADTERAVLSKINEIEDADGVGVAVGDVGELAVAGRNVGEAAAAAPDQGQKGRDQQGERKGSQGMSGGGH